MSYRIRNWSEYNAALKQRGSFWIDEAVLEHWIIPNLTGKPGASPYYSDLAIQTMATIKGIYRLAGRQCQGFIESIFELMGVDLPVPEHSTLSRRLGKLSIELPVIPKGGARHVVVDSTGVKVYGEGEWKKLQHGISKRRTWRKLHLGIDEASVEIVEAIATTNDVNDCEVLEELLELILETIEQVSADGAYDTRDCYEAISKRKARAVKARAVIPPRKGAKIWKHGNCKAKRHDRDQNLRKIRKRGRKAWKRESNYHRRSLAETGMFRFKTIFGGTVWSRTFENQAVEMFIKCHSTGQKLEALLHRAFHAILT